MNTKQRCEPTRRAVRNHKFELSVWISRILILAVVLLSLYPILFVVNTSLKTQSDFFGNLWGFPQEMHFENYAVAWVQGHIGEYFLNSLVVTLVSLAFTLLFSAIAGYAIAKLNMPFPGAWMMIMFISLIIPRESITLSLYQTMVRIGWVNTIYLPMIIVYIGWSMPMSVIILKNFFETLPEELLEAARIDGAKELSVLRHVVTPLMAPALGTVAIFDFCGIWGELMWGQISTASTEAGITLPIGLLSFQGKYGTSWGPLSAAICVVIVPLIVLFLCLQKYFIQGLTAGGLKG